MNTAHLFKARNDDQWRGTKYGLPDGEDVVYFQVSENFSGKVCVGYNEYSAGVHFSLTQEQAIKWGPDIIEMGIIKVVSGFIPNIPAIRKIEGTCPCCGEDKLFENGDHKECGWCVPEIVPFPIDWDSIPVAERLTIFEWDDE